MSHYQYFDHMHVHLYGLLIDPSATIALEPFYDGMKNKLFFLNSMYTNTIPEDREGATEGFVDVREEVVREMDLAYRRRTLYNYWTHRQTDGQT